MKKMKKGLLIAMMALTVSASSAMLISCDKDKNKVAYTFNTNGGNQISSVQVSKGSTYELPVPTREGYAFEGWYTTEDFSGEAVTEVVVSSAQTYYAKWVQLYTVTLDADGGSLTQTTISLKVGANIYEAVKNSVPTKSGLTFGAWFKDGVELSANTKMPETNITLTAKYKVAYTIEIYQQNKTQNGYEKLTEDVVGSEYVGTAFTAKQTYTGFKKVTNANTVETKTLSATAAENVFKLYFDRESYRVTFNPNYPMDGVNETMTETLVYGEEITVPYEYRTSGYCLVGWATSATAKTPTYKVNYLDALVYGQKGAEIETDKFSPERNTVLYGVWMRGYVDLFGNDDTLYILSEDAKEIYLARGELYFKGEYKANTKTFRFRNAKKEIVLQGRLNSDGTFAYADGVRNGNVYTLQDPVKGLNEEYKIRLDEYNGMTYTYYGKTTTEISKGTYVIDSDGYYIVTFEEGKLKGQTLMMALSTVGEDNVFRLRNDEEIAMGTLQRGIVSNGVLRFIPVENGYTLSFNGFGIATYTIYGGDTYTWSYSIEDDTEKGIKKVTMTEQNGEIAAVAGIVDVDVQNNKKGYILYDENLYCTYESEDGATLQLDGMCQATYKKGSTVIEGVYTATESLFGGHIVTVFAGANTYTYHVLATSEEVMVNGKLEEQMAYVFSQKTNGYAEYYYADNEGTIYYVPMIVFNEPEVGKASIYGMTESKDYVKLSQGSVTQNADGLYVYTTEQTFNAEAAEMPVDLMKINVIVFDIGEARSYAVSYWHSVETDAGLENFTEVYVSGNDKLTLVGGFAIYEGEGKVLTGEYTMSNGNVVLTLESSIETCYFKLDSENKSFTKLKYRPYKASLMMQDGNFNTKEYISFDGTGVATYTVETGVTEKTEFIGTYAQVNGEKTANNRPVYTFTATGKTFKFVLIETVIQTMFSPYSTTYQGAFNSANEGLLTLDGYCDYAQYIDTQGKTVSGMYTVEEEGLIRLMAEERTYYFDVTEKNGQKTFTLRGEEYGEYMLLDNHYAGEKVFFEFGGYGNLKVYTYANVGDGEQVRSYIDEKGTYVRENGRFKLTYTDGAKSVTVIGDFGKETYEDMFLVSHEEVVQTYVHESEKGWAILILDDLGNASKYSMDGIESLGYYTLITENMLFYESKDGADRCIYNYNAKTGVATAIDNLKSKGYYTADLESLKFDAAGFAVFGDKDGEEMHFYSQASDGSITLYRRAGEGDKVVNDYGFVVDESFGILGETIKYNGDYYIQNTGYAISFIRTAENAEKYPLTVGGKKYTLATLAFAPTGTTEFSVSGTAKLFDSENNELSVICRVERKKTETGKLVMHITVSTMRFDVDVVYGGEDSETGVSNSTYEVKGARIIETLHSYVYLENYYMLYSIFGPMVGQIYANEFGVIEINHVYNEVGEKTETYVTAEFGKSSKMFDMDGNVVSFERAEYNEDDSSASFTGKDGAQYKIYFTRRNHPAFNVKAYVLAALARVETLTTTNGFEVTVERVIASDYAEYKVGKILAIRMKQNGEDVKLSLYYSKGDMLYCVAHTTDEETKKITEAKYYKLSLKSNVSGPSENIAHLDTYASAEVTMLDDVTVYYTADGNTAVEISQSEGVLLMYHNKEWHTITASTKQDEKMYTVTTSGKDKFTIKVEEDGTVTVTAVKESN